VYSVCPHKWLPIGYRSSAGQGSPPAKRSTFYRYSTQPKMLFNVKRYYNQFIVNNKNNIWVYTTRSFSDVTTWQNWIKDFFRSLTQCQAGCSEDETGWVTPVRKYMLPASVTAQTDCEPTDTWTSFSLLWSVTPTTTVFSEVNSRSRSLFAVARPSVICLSVVCNVRAPYSSGSNFRQYFYGIRYLGHPLTSTGNFTEIVPGEPLRRGSSTQEG